LNIIVEDSGNYAKNSLDKTLSGKPKMQKPYPIVRFHFHSLNCKVINAIHVTDCLGSFMIQIWQLVYDGKTFRSIGGFWTVRSILSTSIGRI